MKDSINYYYNLNIEEVENWDNLYRFKIKNDTFYFVPFKRNINEIDDVINISRELKERKIDVHDIILNKYGKPITNIYNENYILLRPIGDYLEEYSLLDIEKTNNIVHLNNSKSSLYRNLWVKMWSNKIDYFEYQIHELGKGKNIILDSISYYIGLGENAISYANNIINTYKISNNDLITISHRRISVPNYKLNYLNPLNFIFDLEVRDIAEYLKSAFFNNEDALNLLTSTLKIKKFTPYSLGMLYARILYPTFYFDIYEKVMNNNENEEELISIIEKTNNYQEFLKKAYLEISKYAILPRIDWIMNEK